MEKKEKKVKKEKKKVPVVKYENFTIHTAIYKTLLTKKYKNRKAYEVTDPKLVISEIPGTVRQVFIKKGQKVEAGEIMLELEAMKMYNKILAPEKGEIKTVHVKTGDSIPKKFVMVEMK